MAKQEMNLVKLIERFRSDDVCREYLESIRWPEGVRCPRCANEKVSKIEKRNQYDCNACRYQFSVTSGTIFHDTHLPLWKWFLTAYMMIESKKGVSACQIQRTVGVSYRTAWYLCHRIRKAMTGAYPFPLKGIVEIDETYVGGKVRGKGKGYKDNKTIVAGAVQRDGKIILKVIPFTDRETLHGFIQDNVSKDADAIHTDEWKAYTGIDKVMDVTHKTVTHKKEWVADDGTHTNNVENIWGLFKRSIVGTYHKLSRKHLQAYLEELEWRFNNRDNPWLFRDTVQRLIASGNVEYKELVS